MDAVGDLWVADANSLNRYSPRQLASSGYALPATKLSVASPASLSFDAQGGAWISTGNALQRFDPAQLGKDGAPTPAASYAFGAATIHAFAFDAVGELWITCSEASRTKLIMLSPAQLAAAGPPTPFVALQTAPGSAAPSLLLVDPSPAGFPLYGVPR
jgi:ligand-binding sensor domain-containing protein